MEASTGIREGRYRQQDAAFYDIRRRLSMLNTRMAATASTSGKADDGSGRYQHIELEDLNLISRPATAVIFDGSKMVQQYPVRSIGDMKVTRKGKVDSNSMV